MIFSTAVSDVTNLVGELNGGRGLARRMLLTGWFVVAYAVTIDVAEVGIARRELLLGHAALAFVELAVPGVLLVVSTWRALTRVRSSGWLGTLIAGVLSLCAWSALLPMLRGSA